MTDQSPALELRDVRKRYDTPGGTIDAMSLPQRKTVGLSIIISRTTVTRSAHRPSRSSVSRRESSLKYARDASGQTK